MKLASWVVVTGVAVVVARAHAEPRLRVAGAKDGVLSLTVRDGLALSRTVRVVADTSEPAADVVVAISPFEEPGGGQAKVEPVRRTFESVTLDAPAVLDLKATFPRPGRYTAELDVIANRVRATTRLEVEVVLQVLGLQVPAAVAIRGEGGGSREITLAVRENVGRAVTLLEPRASASIKSGDRSYQIPVQVVGVKRNGVPVAGTVPIGKGEDVRIGVDLGGLDAPGEYGGTVRLFAEGTEPVDVPFTATVKESWWHAGLWIGAGVLLSALVRLWYRRWRKRLESRRSLVLLDERIGAIEPRAATGEGRALILTLRSHVGELRTQLAVEEPVADLPASILRLGAKLSVAEAWLEADRVIAQLPAGDVRTALRTKLDEAAATLGRRGADDAAIAAATTAVADLRVREKWRGVVAAEVDRVKQAVEQARKATPGAIQVRIRDDIDPRVKEAERLLAEDALERLVGDAGQLAELLRRLGEVLVGALVAVLHKPKPPFMDSATWKAHGAAVEQALTRPTLEVYRAGLLVHLRGLARALAERARSDAEHAEADYPETAAKLSRLAADLDSAEKIATAADTAALSAAYDAALAEWPKLLGEAQGADTRDEVIGALGEMLATLPAAVLRVIRMESLPAPSSARGISWLLRGSELVVFLMLFVAAVMTGLNLLWTDDATWGGAKAHVIAFLWGFGLHQVGAGATFEGILGLRDKLSPTTGGA